MARYLIDTNLLLRLSDTPSPQNPVAGRALARLFREGHEVFITAKNLIEFCAVATRPLNVNGLGWDLIRVRTELKAIREKFPLLPESPEILDKWLRLIDQFSIADKRVHDARLVAVMKANGMDHLLTFNGVDFRVFTDISIIEPGLYCEFPRGQEIIENRSMENPHQDNPR